MQQLLSVALEMLDHRDFEAITVNELCEGAGVSIGPFYARFESKETFFRFLQLVVVEDTFARSKAKLGSPNPTASGLEDFLDLVVNNALLWYQKYEGLIRASLRQSQSDPKAWEPLRELGARQSELIQQGVLSRINQPRDSQPDTPLLQETISFAIQTMIGTFNNMVLVNSKPLSIRHHRTKPLMVKAMLLQIEDAASRATAK